MALTAVHDMAKKMNENLRIIYSIFTDFFWVIRASQRNSFLMDFGTKWEFLCLHAAEMNAIYILFYTIAISIFQVFHK